MKPAGEDYTCSMCGETYERPISDEEAFEETKENFGSSVQPEDCAIVCDDCYKKVMGQGLAKEETQ